MPRMIPVARACAARAAIVLAIASALAVPAIARQAAPLDLLTAARKGDVALVRQALAAGADVDARDPTFSQTALMRAAMFAQPATTTALIAARARTDLTSDGKRTALHWAAIGGSGEVVRLLVKAGAAVDAGDAYDETPLGFAATEGAVDAAQALLAAGARADRMRRSLADRLALVIGNDVTGAKLEVLRLLIRQRQGLDSRTENEGETPLLVVASHAHHAPSAGLARDLLAAGANPAATNKAGRTAEQEVQFTLASSPSPALVTNLQATLAALQGRGAR